MQRAVIRSGQRNGPTGTEKGILFDETVCDGMLRNHVRYDASELLERATPLAA
jgi:hypothetical protein